MLKFATNAYISALGVKTIKTKGKQCLGRLNIFWGLIKTLWRHYICQNLWLDFLTSALGSNKGRQITTIVKDWWFSMSQSQSVRLFLLNHWDRLFSDGFQMKNNRLRCFTMVVNNRSSDAIIPMHRSSLVWCVWSEKPTFLSKLLSFAIW